jgi:hypothetical protein
MELGLFPSNIKNQVTPWEEAIVNARKWLEKKY